MINLTRISADQLKHCIDLELRIKRRDVLIKRYDIKIY